MWYKYSPSLRGWFPRGEGAPNDAVIVEGADRDALFAAQQVGKQIVPDPNGRPVIYTPTLAERREMQRAVINAARDAATAGGFMFQGHAYQSDDRSRRRLIGAAANITASAAVPTDYVWRTTDNQNITMSGPTVVAFSIYAQNHESAILTISRQLKDQIVVSDNPESIVWPAVIPPIVDVPKAEEPLLGSTVVNVPAAAATALQPEKVAIVATSGKYADLTGKPNIPMAVDTTQFATKAQGLKADTAIQQPALDALITQIPKGAVIMDLATDGNALKTQALSGYTVTPRIIPVWTVANAMGYFPEITAASATSVSVKGWKTRSVLLVSSGPIEVAPNATVRIAILP